MKYFQSSTIDMQIEDLSQVLSVDSSGTNIQRCVRIIFRNGVTLPITFNNVPQGDSFYRELSLALGAYRGTCCYPNPK